MGTSNSSSIKFEFFPDWLFSCSTPTTHSTDSTSATTIPLLTRLDRLETFITRTGTLFADLKSTSVPPINTFCSWFASCVGPTVPYVKDTFSSNFPRIRNSLLAGITTVSIATTLQHLSIPRRSN